MVGVIKTHGISISMRKSLSQIEVHRTIIVLARQNKMQYHRSPIESQSSLFDINNHYFFFFMFFDNFQRCKRVKVISDQGNRKNHLNPKV